MVFRKASPLASEKTSLKSLHTGTCWVLFGLAFSDVRPGCTVVQRRRATNKADVDQTLHRIDFSVGTSIFESGVVARLVSVSVIAPHDHELRIIGDKGGSSRTSAVNAAPVRVRALYFAPTVWSTPLIARRLRLKGQLIYNAKGRQR
jgi:hypothetical protein